jgi:hypothetical protein
VLAASILPLIFTWFAPFPHGDREEATA